MSMRKPSRIAGLFLGVLLLTSLSAGSEASTEHCNVNVLSKLKDTRLESLRLVKKYAEEPDSKRTPYLSPYLKAYYHSDELKGFDLTNSGEYGFTEYRYWTLSKASFLVDQRESWYDQPIDMKAGLKIAQRFGNRFFVCDGKVVKVEPLRDFEPFRYSDSQIEFSLQTIYHDTTVLIFGAVLPAQAERLWLVIGASDASPAGIAHKGKVLTPLSANGFIVQTRDCGDKRNLFAWVAEATSSAAAAQSGLSRLREKVKDAYVKRCDVKPRTLLAFRVSAVDASIANVAQDAVNWQDEDRISSIHPLADGRAIAVIRHDVDEDGPFQGRSARVVVVDTAGKRLTLEEDCNFPGRVAFQQGKIAFDCAREVAADHLLHSVVVFNATGEKLAEIKRCRNPRWSRDRTLVCDAETVDVDGQMKLLPKQIN